MDLSQSGFYRGNRVATLSALMLSVVALIGTAGCSSLMPVAPPTTTMTVTTTVTPKKVIVDITKHSQEDYLKKLSTGAPLDLATEYQALLGRRLTFTMTTERAFKNVGLHAVAQLGEYCVLGIQNTPGDTVRIVVASRYNDQLTAELHDVPLFGAPVSKAVNTWYNDCTRGRYVPETQPGWQYATDYKGVAA